MVETKVNAGEPRQWASWAALLMGLLAFWAWAGAYTLAPGHIGWVMAGMDTPAHYLGWQFFRHSPWQWPIGANPAYGTDASGSIVMSDAIPLVALSLKMLSPLLADKFQYLGLWACSCFLLQAWFARKLMTRITDDVIVQLAGVGFFVTATIFLLRVYMHPALAAQWLLLAAIYLVLDQRFRARAWIVILGLAVWIHAYLFVMVAAIWVAEMVRRWICGERLFGQTLLHGVIATITVVLLMWTTGYLMPGAPLGTSIRTYFDLAEPFWTGIRFFGEWSWFLPAMDMDKPAYDGFSYLGLGFAALLFTAIVVWISRRFFDYPTCSAITIQTSSWVTLSVVCGILLLFSASNHVHFAQHLLLSYPIPSWLDHFYGIFRGAARMMWPAWYLLMLAVLYMLLRQLPLPHVRWIVIAGLLVQLCDLSKAAIDVRAMISKSPSWHSTLSSPLWGSLPPNIKHVAYIKTPTLPPELVTFIANYKIIAEYAAKNRMTINVAYLARTDDARLAQASDVRARLLLDGQMEPATLYLVDDDSLWAKLSCLSSPGRWLGTVNGMRVIVPDTVAEIKLLPAATCAR